MIGPSLARYLILSVAVCAAVCINAAAQTYRSPELEERETDRAFHKLLHAHIFNFGGVGFVNQITEEEKAFEVIFQSAVSAQLFQQLLSEGNGEGQLYALFGLRATARASFRLEAQGLQKDEGPGSRIEGFTIIPKGKVRMGRGCILYQQDMQTVIDEIAKGDWDAAFFSRRKPTLIRRRPIY